MYIWTAQLPPVSLVWPTVLHCLKSRTDTFILTGLLLMATSCGCCCERNTLQNTSCGFHHEATHCAVMFVSDYKAAVCVVENQRQSCSYRNPHTHRIMSLCFLLWVCGTGNLKHVQINGSDWWSSALKLKMLLLNDLPELKETTLASLDPHKLPTSCFINLWKLSTSLSLTQAVCPQQLLKFHISDGVVQLHRTAETSSWKWFVRNIKVTFTAPSLWDELKQTCWAVAACLFAVQSLPEKNARLHICAETWRLN